MTLREMTKQIYNLSVDGRFMMDCEECRCSHNYFLSYVTNKFRDKSVDEIIMKILLPDGWWDLYIYQHDKYGFDYFIPETREQERKHRKYICYKLCKITLAKY